MVPSPLSIVVFSSDPRIRSDTDFGRGVTQPGASWTGGVQVADISAAGQGAATQVNLATRCPGATRLTPQRPRPPRYFDQRSHDIRTIPAEDRAARALRTTRLSGYASAIKLRAQYCDAFACGRTCRCPPLR
jgi:hypothetical protein